MYSSATLGTTDSPSSEAPQTGGCGMIVPNGGDPPGPWQAADLVILAGVALYLMMRRRGNPGYRSASPRRWEYGSAGVFGPDCSDWSPERAARSTAPAGGAFRWVAA
jgi:hypothetical protein